MLTDKLRTMTSDHTCNAGLAADATKHKYIFPTNLVVNITLLKDKKA